MADVVFRGTPEEMRMVLRSISAALAGRGDPYGVAPSIQRRIGVAALSEVNKDFLVKMRGGTGRDGIHWPPLKPETIARRRRTKADVAAAKRQIKAAARVGRPRLTVVELYGSRPVDILKDKGDLLKSLSPGREDRPSGEAHQVFRLLPGQVSVGSDLPRAAAHQNGIPQKNLPPRRMWPQDGSIPEAWWPGILRAAQRGVYRAAVFLLRRHR